MSLKATSVKIPLALFKKMEQVRERSAETQSEFIVEAIRERLSHGRLKK